MKCSQGGGLGRKFKTVPQFPDNIQLLKSLMVSLSCESWLHFVLECLIWFNGLDFNLNLPSPPAGVLGKQGRPHTLHPGSCVSSDPVPRYLLTNPSAEVPLPRDRACDFLLSYSADIGVQVKGMLKPGLVLCGIVFFKGK